MNAKPNYDYGYVKVELKAAGVFSGMSISGVHYDTDTHLKDAAEQIERHVDRVRGTEIIYDYYTCGECGRDFESEKEADDCCMPAEEIPQFKGTKEQLDNLTPTNPIKQ